MFLQMMLSVIKFSVHLKILEAHVQTLTYFLQTLFWLPSKNYGAKWAHKSDIGAISSLFCQLSTRWLGRSTPNTLLLVFTIFCKHWVSSLLDDAWPSKTPNKPSCWRSAHPSPQNSDYPVLEFMWCSKCSKHSKQGCRSSSTVVGFRVRVNIYNNHDYDDDRHGVIVNEDDEWHDGERDHEDVDVHREALRGGGWFLEWLHPPPKGVQRKGRERKWDDKRERERDWERTMILYSFIPHKGLNRYKGLDTQGCKTLGHSPSHKFTNSFNR